MMTGHRAGTSSTSHSSAQSWNGEKRGQEDTKRSALGWGLLHEQLLPPWVPGAPEEPPEPVLLSATSGSGEHSCWLTFPRALRKEEKKGTFPNINSCNIKNKQTTTTKRTLPLPKITTIAVKPDMARARKATAWHGNSIATPSKQSYPRCETPCVTKPRGRTRRRPVIAADSHLGLGTRPGDLGSPQHR